MTLELASCQFDAVANAPAVGAVRVFAQADDLNLILAFFAARSVALILAERALVLVEVGDVIFAAFIAARGSASAHAGVVSPPLALEAEQEAFRRRIQFAQAPLIKDKKLLVPLPPRSGMRATLGVVDVDDKQRCTLRRLELALVHPLPSRGGVVEPQDLGESFVARANVGL